MGGTDKRGQKLRRGNGGLARGNPKPKNYEGKTNSTYVDSILILAHEEPYGDGHGVTINGDGSDPPGHAKLQERPTNHIVAVMQTGHLLRSFSKAYPLYYRTGTCTRRLS